MARIKVKFPDEIWIAYVFKEFPDVRMEISYFLPYDLERSIGNAIVEIKHYNIDEILEDIKEHDSVHRLRVVEREENRMVINVQTRDPYLLYGVIKHGVLVDFPVRVKDGNAYWKLISTRTSIDQLLTYFEKSGIQFDLLRIGNSPYELEERSNTLSLDEERILQEAIKEGFFEVPREISLEDLAHKLGRSKSSLSVLLRKIIKKKVVMKNE